MKKLILLTLFLIGNLHLNSQKLSTQDSLCSVPCYTLRNALLLKADHEYLQNQMQIIRDSVSTLNNIIDENNIIINDQNDIISLQKQSEKILTDIVDVKNKEIKNYKEEIKKQKIKTTLVSILGVTSVIYSIYITVL